MTRVAVIGAGSWGTAVAAIVAGNVPTVLWARRPELAAAIDRGHENADYLRDIPLPAELRATADLAQACEGADVVVFAVPSHGLRAVVAEARPYVGAQAAIVSLAKGIEQGTLRRMTEVIAEELADHDPDRIGVLTGPNLAREVAAGQPTASVVAVPDAGVAEELQRVFFAPTLRVYTNPDVVGCEMAGALKNVLAIGAGIADGLGYGDNTKAALITRGLAELARLGGVLGGDPLTFAGLAGMGDLIATCASPQSRNRHVGVELGRGRALDDIVNEMNMVAEGVKTTAAVIELAAANHVEMPLSSFVGRVLYEGARPADLVPELMLRKAKPELHGLR
ncbi:MAG TPA: NAD(P)H-dependent glycerol-3-phosphate dehydrogenase [Acidimicrobiia bacterium]|jgi:glycerol-3-phosphate dehydrogenase (NAD(P)+)|nr:NAD(P)H-dependent glycerol-3-phosphate dehydrogenase [Acidimicrobiia bacterium]